MGNDVSQELLDVVDFDDNVVAIKTRGEIHKNGLMHRAVHILVFNSGGDLFIQKRSMTKDECPGLWDTSAAGHVESGEDYLTCAKREITEELGVSECPLLMELFRLPPKPETGMEHCTVYKTICDGPFDLQIEEIDEGKWVSTSEMDRRTEVSDKELTDALRLIWHRYHCQQ